ncbi:MAG: hypothetical protein HKL95_03695 [Phycisphaerae bacterium]|nr:hypothetical protein [Phycisphaerae bacterium]
MKSKQHIAVIAAAVITAVALSTLMGGCYWHHPEHRDYHGDHRDHGYHHDSYNPRPVAGPRVIHLG